MLRSLIRILASATIVSAPAIHPTASFAESRTTAESPSLKPDSLMPLAFPGWRRGAKQTVPDPKVSPTEVVKLPLSGKSSAEYFVEPLGVIRLDAHHAAMIASSISIDPESGGLDFGCGGSNYCPGYVPIGAYIFTQGNAGWTLTTRADLVTTVFEDDADKFKVQQWPGHGLVVAFTTSYGYQSASVTNLTMIALQPDRVISLLNTSLSTSSEFIDPGDLGCPTILDPKYAQPKSLSIGSADCSNTAGRWRFEGDRLRLIFDWAARQDDGHGHLKPLKSWKTTAVLQWTGGGLKLVAGKLPEFGI